MYILHNLSTIKHEQTATIQTDGILLFNQSVIMTTDFIKDIHDNENNNIIKCGNQMLQLLSF